LLLTYLVTKCTFAHYDVHSTLRMPHFTTNTLFAPASHDQIRPNSTKFDQNKILKCKPVRFHAPQLLLGVMETYRSLKSFENKAAERQEGQPHSKTLRVTRCTSLPTGFGLRLSFCRLFAAAD